MHTRSLITIALAAFLLVAPSLLPSQPGQRAIHSHAATNLSLTSLISQTVTRFVVTVNAAYGCSADFPGWGNGYFAGYGDGYFANGEENYLYVDWADGSGGYYAVQGPSGGDDVFMDHLSSLHHYNSGGFYPYVEFGSTTYGWCASVNPVI